MSATQVTATILRSGVCRTSALKPRPTPTLFYFPGLTSAPFHEADATKLPVLQRLVDNHASVLAEYKSLITAGTPSDYATKEDEHTLHRGSWDWHSCVQKGVVQPEFAKVCPTTAEVLLTEPRLMTGVPFAFAFFSTLHAGTHITAHSAPCNLRLRVHYPLLAPEGGHLRVGDEWRSWVEGEPIVFDDAFDHEARHDGDPSGGPRVVLLFDLWHPDLTDDEIEGIKHMFASPPFV